MVMQPDVSFSPSPALWVISKTFGWPQTFAAAG
jgi:hypothetical protein